VLCDPHFSFTPIFEWCSRQQRIVIDYPEDKLVLLAMRDNFTGEYLNRKGLVAVGKVWNIPVVNVLDVTDPVPSQEELVTMIRNMSDMEGVVVQFADGHMVKIKADTYVALHRAKSLLENERDVVGLVLDEKVDDLLSLLPAYDRARLRNFDVHVWHDIWCFKSQVNKVLEASINMPRKEFALATSEYMCPLLRAAVFKHWDNPYCSAEYVVELIRKHLGSKAAYEKVKPILKTAMWKGVKTDAE
jgi:RNA ligase